MISSPRLVLRPLTAQEAERTLAGAGPDRLVFVDGYPSAFATQVLRLVALYPSIDHQVRPGAPDLGPWLLLRRTDQAVLGTISCARTARASEISIGYDIAPSCWGMGYATEAVTATVRHLLRLPGIRRVCAETAVDHAASRRVMEKAGMRWQRDEVLVGDGGRGGREVTLVHYAIERARR